MKPARKVVVFALLVLSLIVGATSMDMPVNAASSSWQWKQQSGKESSELKDIAVLNNGTRLAVGDDSTVLRSVKGGRWSPAVIPGKGNLTAMATDGKAAVVVGEGGIAVRSTDGIKWTKGTVKNTIRLDQFNAYYKNKPEGKLELKQDGIRWMDIIWDGKQYVAVGEGEIPGDGYSYSNLLVGVSANGAEWKLTPLVSKESIRLYNRSLQLVKFKSNWIAIASEGVFYSRDLKTWSFKKVDIGADIHAVAASGDVLVAVGWDGRAGTGRALGGAVFTSEDGLSFKRQPGGSFYNISLNAIIWADGRFVAAGHYGTLFESADGKKWKEKTKEHGELMHALYYVKYSGLKGNIYGIAKTEDGFTAVGAVGAIRSTKGLDEEWTLEASGDKGDLYGIAYSGGRYAIAGTGTFKISQDGSKWEDADAGQVNDMTSLYNLYGVSGAFFAAGFQLTTEKLSKADLLYSAGAVKNIQSALAEPIDDVSMAGGELRVFGEKLAASSKDGTKWTPLKGVQAIPIATSGKLWLGYQEHDLYLSKDGKTWSKNKATLDGYTIDYPMKQAVWTGSKFVANNGEELIESVNGKEWKRALKLRFEYFNGLAVNGAGTVVAVGDKGMIYMSEKGKAWIKVPSPTVKTLRSVVWDGKRFMAVGDGGVVVVGEQK
ncbi:hypothetical protein [Paenibacillus sp. GCM10027626]|uniref:hypothetical protein n=1 Tax=Paenibacillus sp. GCM10027626 TaxID=3273411 RepID=UPI00363B0534